MRKEHRLSVILMYVVFLTVIVFGCAVFVLFSSGQIQRNSFSDLWEKVSGSKISDKNDEDTTFSSYVETPVPLPKPEINNSGPGYAMRNALGFMAVNKRAPLSERPILREGEVFIEVAGSGESKSYLLIASGDTEYRGNVGEKVDFNPEVSEKDLIVQGEYDGRTVYFFSYEKDGYTIPDDLTNGDKVVFKCSVPGCTDGKLSWALVFRDYD